jgi:hypothetical protein
MGWDLAITGSYHRDGQWVCFVGGIAADDEQ